MKGIHDFSGTLHFIDPLKPAQSIQICYQLEENWLDHPDWGEPTNLSNIPLYFNPMFSGRSFSTINLRGDEEVHIFAVVNAFLSNMRYEFSDFGLMGSLVVRSPIGMPLWELYIREDGFVYKRVLQKLACPHCSNKLTIEEAR